MANKQRDQRQGIQDAARIMTAAGISFVVPSHAMQLGDIENAQSDIDRPDFTFQRDHSRDRTVDRHQSVRAFSKE